MDTITLNTERKQEIVEITDRVVKLVEDSKVQDGLCMVYTTHSTGAIIINENHDPNIMEDLLNCLEGLVPQGKWLHDRMDNNGAAHIKASICGPGEMIPIKDNKLMLGTWQSIMVADFDGPKHRRVIIQILKG